ncbi:MAG: hypothetical protein WAT92_06860 [Saprospiraceae bacterium]|nr:hypothetical protein [Saprospiraceae bacterium]HMS68596.1 hypothetical protein [Saprospiraceae bacterium]
MPTYDLQDPTDVDILRANFDIISRSEWDEYIALAEQRNIGYKNINILKTAERKAGISKFLSPKVILWVMDLVERLDADDEEE